MVYKLANALKTLSIHSQKFIHNSSLCQHCHLGMTDVHEAHALENAFETALTHYTQQSLLCDSCYKQLTHSLNSDLSCARCDLPLARSSKELQNKQIICASCQDTPPHYQQAICALRYSTLTSLLLKGLKLADTAALHLGASLLANQISARLDNEALKSALIIPIPLWPKALEQRGHNQCLLLSKVLKHKIQQQQGITPALHSEILFQQKASLKQKGLNAKQRQRNIHQAFALSAEADSIIKDRLILLVDDVMTTGSTLNEAARILMQGGASSVVALAVARTPLKP